MESSSSTSSLTSSSFHVSTSRKISFGKLSSLYGFSGSIPYLPKKSSQSPKSSPKSKQPSKSLLSSSTHSSVVQSPKDYETSFAHLSSTYGFGGSVPSLPPSVPEQPKPFVSSQAKVVQSSNVKDYEKSFGQLSSVYGFGSPVSSVSKK
ncbi:hypothetical protein GALMADRAFT_138356 [Galerina marginata CBS 339.88]|uniref:Uncharacterized protein n=1 Tax=Galerina marginata (strain CBS 339.88) TaxID=685588 RepID=A0A067T792_GALM3|nr:hypothetical protein GALMADRAFT_138356 [Galerina marginata CBS 339.88]